MDLVNHLRIATPLIWIKSVEPERVADIVVENVRRKIFRLDPFDGLVTYKDNKWVKVIIEKEQDGQIVETTANDFAESLMHVLENKGTMIINHAHKVVEDLIPFFSGIYGSYRKAYFENNLEDCPAQFIFVACNDEIPPEIGSHVAYVDFPLPGPEELASILARIGLSVEDKEDVRIDFQGSIHAGLGLTEMQFMQIAALQLSKSHEITGEYIAERKRDLIKQGGVLEIRKPKMGLDDIGGLDLAKEIINQAVWIWNNPDQAAEFGLAPINRILMVGVPGTGKSAICEATAKTLGLDLAKTGISQSMNRFIGQSEANMRAAFAQINAMAPLVVWMDELGRDLSSGDYEGDSGTTSRVHGEFLTGLQELPENVFLMAAANRIDRVAPEMLRADRFDRIMFVGLPSVSERVEIFRIHLGAQADGIDLMAVAQQSDTFTGAEIKQLVKETRLRVSASEQRHINTDDILRQIPLMRNRLWLKDPEMIRNMYRRARVEWDWASSEQLADADRIIGAEMAQVKRVGNAQYTTFGN